MKEVLIKWMDCSYIDFLLKIELYCKIRFVHDNLDSEDRFPVLERKVNVCHNLKNHTKHELFWRGPEMRYLSQCIESRGSRSLDMHKESMADLDHPWGFTFKCCFGPGDNNQYHFWFLYFKMIWLKASGILQNDND